MHWFCDCCLSALFRSFGLSLFETATVRWPATSLCSLDPSWVSIGPESEHSSSPRSHFEGCCIGVRATGFSFCFCQHLQPKPINHFSSWRLFAAIGPTASWKTVPCSRNPPASFGLFRLIADSTIFCSSERCSASQSIGTESWPLNCSRSPNSKNQSASFAFPPPPLSAAYLSVSPRSVPSST